MTVELAFMLVFCLSGGAFLLSWGTPTWTVWPLGLILGIGLYSLVAVGQILLHLPSSPLLSAALTALLSVPAWRSARRSIGWRDLLFQTTLLVLGTGLGVWAFWKLNLVGYHTDSFRYLEAARLIAAGRVEWIDPILTRTRMATFPILLAPSALNNSTHLRSLSPLLAVASLWLLGGILLQAQRRLSPAQSRPIQGLLVLAPLALLASNNRFLFNASYLNGHLLFASCLLCVSGFGWLRSVGTGLPPTATACVMGVAAATAALDRPEGPLVVALALLPAACSTRLTKFERLAPVIALAGALVLWHGHVCLSLLLASRPMEKSAAAMLVLGLVLGGVAVRFTKRPMPNALTHMPAVVEVALWLALGALWLRNPAVLTESLSAIKLNFLQDGASWGSSAWILAVLVSLVLIATQLPERRMLRFPVTTFVPLSLVLAYLREAPYRDGNRDSLTRMLLHFLPLAVLLVASCALGALRRPSAAAQAPGLQKQGA